MNWKNLISPTKTMNAEQVKSLVNSRSEGDYQILDVRQPKEYEAGHLPGAIFIPLAELPSRVSELDKNKPLITYCAVGGRSRAAAQFLAGQDFKEVYNLVGGIKSWQGNKASGPVNEGLELFTGDEEFGDAVSLAYTMEDGLQGFYQTLALDATDQGLKELFLKLASVEGKHKAALAEEYRNVNEGGFEESIPLDIPAGIMEGGGKVAEFLEQGKGYLNNPAQILELAMSLETQAYDLYSRMARKATNEAIKGLFMRLVDEEKVHIRILSQEFDKYL